MAERFKAAVLKTVEVRASGGSNPSLPATFIYHNLFYAQRFLHHKLKVIFNALLTLNFNLIHFQPYILCFNATMFLLILLSAEKFIKISCQNTFFSS